jgi:isopentenyl-diphosphate delta-isomerase
MGRVAPVADDISKRKADHLAIAASQQVEFHRSTLLEHVHLVHQALPELAVDEIDLATELAGKRLRAPLVITGMTGGTAEAAAVNRDLARAAQDAGVALGLGSQRAMGEHPELADTYDVRAVAPDVVLFGNVGAVQLAAWGAARATELAKRIGADAMCVHLNAGQELIQDGGDRDFRGLVAAIELLVKESMPVIVKETGCGLSPQAARMLAGVGVSAVDTAGAGGTSWVAVEAVRAKVGSDAAALGEELWDWGLPTAVSVAACVDAGLVTIASGGMRTGYDVARALALGARAGGMAAPMLRAQRSGGADAVRATIDRVTRSIRAVCLLAGARSAADLARVPRHLGAPLRAFLDDLGISGPR